MSIYILGIESSCDDTSAAIIKDNVVLSNVIANQSVHEQYGGVVPELASRAHQQNIIPVIDAAIRQANIQKNDIHAVAFTKGPGLLGSLLVGVSFAKAFALALNIPLVEVDHLEAHILAHFLQNQEHSITHPKFPFLCLTVSGGHTQIVKVEAYNKTTIIGQTIDDAAGEAFDKIAKIMQLPYPGGPVLDKMAQVGNADKFKFPKPNIKDFDYSFSGLKTSVLYFLRDQLKENPNFIEEHKVDLAASVQKTIVDILMQKLIKASKATGIKEIAIAGGVSANSGLRNAVLAQKEQLGWNVFLPHISFSTDNAAMIAIAGYFKYQDQIFSNQHATPYSRSKTNKKYF